MKQFVTQLPPSSRRVFFRFVSSIKFLALILVVAALITISGSAASVGTYNAARYMITEGLKFSINLQVDNKRLEIASDSTINAVSAQLALTVNALGDAADVNVGDGHCDTDGNLGNGDQCTLRAAIEETNAASTDDTITFDLGVASATVILNTALPNINGNLTIRGSGASLLTVQRSTVGGTPQFRIFTINDAKTVTIDGLTVTNGHAPDAVFGGTSGGFGGGIENAGTLHLTNCVINANRSGDGGGGFGVGGGGGGGIYNFGVGVLTLINSTVSNNVTGFGGNSLGGGGSGGFGGGIRNDGTLTLINSTVSGNQGGNGGSGGAFAGGHGGGGGGIGNSNTLILINSTVSNNRTGSGGSGAAASSGGLGGGISNSGTLTLLNSTVAENQTGSGGTGGPGGNGGGIWTQDSFITNLKNTIIARNTVGLGGSGKELFGTFNSRDHNLIEDISGATVTGMNTHNIINTDSKIRPLSNNGGRTQTHALLADSPALDAGDNCVIDDTCVPAHGFSLTTDQRGTGFSRRVDGPDADTTATVDMGACETQVTLANIADMTTNEDTQLIVPFEIDDRASITSITATSDNQTLIPNNPGNLLVTDAGSTEVITINPAANLFGIAHITVMVNRTGGSASRTFTVTVNSANDAPSFIKGADQTVNEDSGGQIVTNWATNLSAGPADESGQALAFQVIDNTNASLFSSGPAISSTGTLTYTAAANANGSATITVVLKDNGGTANGGVDTSVAQSFVITVNPVNDAPSFTKGLNQTVNNNAGAQTVNNWATGISAGPNESGQTVTFLVTDNSNPGLFAVPPAVSSTGTLTYTPATNAGGNAIITIVLKDNGGTASGGQDTSQPETFNIDITPAGGFLRFDSSNFTTTESSGSTTITVKRAGDTSLAVAVDFATSGDSGVPCSTAVGVASSKCDFTSALGTLNFAVGEDTKTFVVLISQDSYTEGPETLNLSLTNPAGFASLAQPSAATLSINDDASEPATNPNDDAQTFVRQHYHDFLNREPDAAGLAFWTNEITSCGIDPQCIEIKRINVSAAFFLSIEFENTGFLVYRMFKTAYGDTTSPNVAIPVPIIRFNEFLPDAQRIGQGVQVGIGPWEAQLEANKNAYAREFVVRQRFLTEYPLTMTAAQFVDKLNLNAGGVLSQAERDQLIAELTAAGDVTQGRASVLRKVAEDADLRQRETTRAFVLMQYYGYLRRNPDDPQDTDFRGWEFWLNKLNQFNGNFVQAEMVKAFIVSIEYRQRFGN